MIMDRIPMDVADWQPSDLKKYLMNYGHHFTRKSCEYACSMMKKKDASGNKVKIAMIPKDEVEAILKKYGVDVDSDLIYDAVYLYNMARADYPKTLPDDAHIATYIQETMNDVDGSKEDIFRTWYAKAVSHGESVPWYDFV
jgi:hypothetical protein